MKLDLGREDCQFFLHLSEVHDPGGRRGSSSLMRRCAQLEHVFLQFAQVPMLELMYPRLNTKSTSVRRENESDWRP